MSSGQSKIYTWPLTTDIDNDLVTISFTTTCIYPVTLASGDLTFIPAISDIGTCSVTLNLLDGFNNVPYTPISILTTNSPPVFISAISSGETINAGLSNTYTLPATTDIDGDTVAISIYQGSSVVASIAGNILTINPSVLQVGTFPIFIQLSDGLN